MRAQLKKHQSEKRDFPFLKISDKNKDELDELKQLMEVPSHRSKEEVPIGVQPGLDNAIGMRIMKAIPTLATNARIIPESKPCFKQKNDLSNRPRLLPGVLDGFGSTR